MFGIAPVKYCITWTYNKKQKNRRPLIKTRSAKTSHVFLKVEANLIFYLLRSKQTSEALLRIRRTSNWHGWLLLYMFTATIIKHRHRNTDVSSLLSTSVFYCSAKHVLLRIFMILKWANASLASNCVVSFPNGVICPREEDAIFSSSLNETASSPLHAVQ